MSVAIRILSVSDDDDDDDPGTFSSRHNRPYSPSLPDSLRHKMTCGSIPICQQIKYGI